MKFTVSKHNVIPGFRPVFCVTLVMLLAFILIPLFSVLVSVFQMEPRQLIRVITDDTVVWAFVTSIGVSFAAAVINTVFGLLLAWVLVRYNFPGRRIMDSLIELPFALPTAVAGITLSKLYSDTGWFGKIGLDISYSHAGLVVALVFVGIPFVVRAIQPVLLKIDSGELEAARLMGASAPRTFFKVILPKISGAMMMGFALAFARGIGEYGSVIYISGNNAREHTQVVSYVIMQKLNYMDYSGASAVALVMLIISFVLLLLMNRISHAAQKRGSGRGDSGKRASAFAVPKSITAPAEFLLVVVAAMFVLVMLIIPVVYVISQALSKGFGFFVSALCTDTVVSALGVTVFVAVIAVLVNTFFGMMAGVLMTRFRFRGKEIMGALIDIPFSVSPVIAGLSYIMMFGRLGWAYPFIEWFNEVFGTGLQIVFAVPGVVLATIFVTFPFVSREIIPVLNACGSDEEEAAALMGAGGLRIFRQITLPQAKWGLLYGVILCTARAFGEFGAVHALSKTRGETFTLPLEIDALYMSGSADSIVAAFVVSSLLVMLAGAVLVVRSIVEKQFDDR